MPLLGRRSPRPPGGLSRGWVSRPWFLGCGTKSTSKEGAGKLDLIEMKDFCALKDIPEDERSANHTPGEGPTPTCVENTDNPTAESQPSGNGGRTWADISPATTPLLRAGPLLNFRAAGGWGWGRADRASSKPPAPPGRATNSISRLHDRILLLC